MSDNRDEMNMGTIGDPAEALCVATVIMAMQRMRTIGLPGPFEYHLRTDQVSGIEQALVADSEGRPMFRGVPVVPSGVDRDGRIVDTSTGRWLAILSRYDDHRPDYRASRLNEQQVMALRWEAAEHREMFKAHADR